MPFTMTALARGNRCHGSWRVIADEDDLVRKVARPMLAQSCQMAATFADIDKKAPATSAAAAKGGASSRPTSPLSFVFGEPVC